MKIILRPSKRPNQIYDAYPISPADVKKGLSDGTIIEIEPGVYKQVALKSTEYDTKVMTAKGKGTGKSKTTKKPGRPPAKNKPGRPRKTAATK